MASGVFWRLARRHHRELGRTRLPCAYYPSQNRGAAPSKPTIMGCNVARGWPSMALRIRVAMGLRRRVARLNLELDGSGGRRDRSLRICRPLPACVNLSDCFFAPLLIWEAEMMD